MSDETSTATGGTTATADAATQTSATQTTQAQATTQTAAADATTTQKAAAVPEKYDLKAPEGYTFNEVALATFQDRARARGLTQAQAQEDMDYLVGELMATEQRRAEAWQAQQEAWLAAVKADKELGGKNFEQTVSRSRHAMAVIDPTGELRKVVDALGIGNNLVMVRAWARLGALFENDPVDAGGAPSASGPASAKEMFPNSKMN